MRNATVGLACFTLAVAWVCVAAQPDATESQDQGEVTNASFSGQPIRGHVQAPPVAFRELVRSADRIFIGSVTAITKAEAFKEQTGVAADDVTFTVNVVLKGKKVDRIRQPAALGVFREKSGPLLLYLSPDSGVGLTQPIGVYSGYFEIRGDSNPSRKSELVAINLHNNEGLWDRKMPMIGDSTGELKTLGNMIDSLKVTATEAQYLYRFATTLPSKPCPVPLNVMIAATRTVTRIETKKEKD